MHPNAIFSSRRLALLLAFLALAACGGGDDPASGNDDDNNDNTANQAPTAEAGDAQSVDAGVTVTLAGSGSDADGNIESWAWAQIAGPDVTLAGGDDGSATFTAPSVDAATELAFELTVTDDAGDSASDDVSVTVAPVVAMSGRVYDGPLAGATVTVTVGDREYTAVADDNGNYQINVGSLAPDAFVTITARGGAGQENVELVSIAASFGALQSAAGDDGVLDDGESGSVDVTNLSTAKAVLMIEANGGEPITTDADAAAAEKNVNGDEMIRLATVIKLVVDGGYDLPEGVDSTLDLVDDVATAEAFIDDVEAHDPEAFEAMQETMLADGELLDTFDASDVPDEYTLLLVNTLESSGAIEYMYGSRGPRYEFDVNGSGTLVSSSEGVSGPFTWEVINGEIAISFTAPLVLPGFCSVDGYAVQLECETTVTERYLRLVLDGAVTDQLRVRTVGELTYPFNGELEPEAVDSSSSWIAMGADGEIPFTAEELVGTWAFDVAGEDLTGLQNRALGSGLVRFDADGTGERIATDVSPAMTLDWQITADGRLEFAYADGTQVSVRRLREESVGFDAQVQVTLADATVFNDAGLIVKAEADVYDASSAADVVGFFTLFDIHPYFAVILQDGGSGALRNYWQEAGEWLHADSPLAWTLREDGTIVMRYAYDVDAFMYVASCDGVANCTVRERSWIPVAYDDARGLVFAYERQDTFAHDEATPDGKGELLFVQTSMRFWGHSETSLDGDGVLGKPGEFDSERRRAPWVKWPVGTWPDFR